MARDPVSGDFARRAAQTAGSSAPCGRVSYGTAPADVEPTCRPPPWRSPAHPLVFESRLRLSGATSRTKKPGRLRALRRQRQQGAPQSLACEAHVSITRDHQHLAKDSTPAPTRARTGPQTQVTAPDEYDPGPDEQKFILGTVVTVCGTGSTWRASALLPNKVFARCARA